MNTTISIKNFRAFDEDGATFEINPIMILTGSNSSGKSSVVKAILLLQDFCQQLKEDYEEGREIHLESYKMDFHKQPNSILGSFDLVRHIKDSLETEQSDSENNITIEVRVHSYWLLQDVILRLEFGTIDTDDLNDGYLKAYSILTLDKKILYKAVRGEDATMDFRSVKNALLHFLYCQHVLSKWQEDIYSMDVRYFEHDPKESLFEDANAALKAIPESIGEEADLDILKWTISEFNRKWLNRNQSLLEYLSERKVESSFVKNSPALNVCCYFPCLEFFKDMDKSVIVKTIKQKLESQKSEGKPKDEKSILNRIDITRIEELLSLFEDSDAGTLHELISSKEDDLFFHREVIYHNIDDDSFIVPHRHSYLENRTRKHKPGSGQYYALFGDELKQIMLADPEWEIIINGMTHLNMLITDTPTYYQVFNDFSEESIHFMEEVSTSCFRRMILELFTQLIPGSVSYSPTTVVKPQRLYSLENNTDFSNTLKYFFEMKRIYTAAKTTEYPSFMDHSWTGGNYILSFWEQRNLHPTEYEPGTFINKWLKQLDIADHVEMKTLADGYGVSILLFDSESDNKGMLIADKGIGILQVFTLLLKIEIAIIQSQYNELRYHLFTYGLNEELFKYFETYNQQHPITVALEEPESHLHPKYQSLLADMFLEANEKYNIHFIIETHSEYLIRKAQVLVAKHQYENEETLNKENPFKVYYVPLGDKPYEMEFNADGRFKNEFGKGFFDEASNLVYEII